MFVCCECFVLSGRGLCNGVITRPEESYRLWRVVVCDKETSRMRRLKSATGLWKYNQNGCNAKKTNKQLCYWKTEITIREFRPGKRSKIWGSYSGINGEWSLRRYIMPTGLQLPIEGAACFDFHCQAVLDHEDEGTTLLEIVVMQVMMFQYRWNWGFRSSGNWRCIAWIFNPRRWRRRFPFHRREPLPRRRSVKPQKIGISVRNNSLVDKTW